MLDFIKWQTINESLAGAGFSLGLTKPHTLGGLIGKFQYLDEKKKHMDKDVEEEDLEDDDMDVDMDDADSEMDSDEGAEECGPKFCGKNMKKKMKKVKNECDCDDKKKPVEMSAEDEDGDEDEEMGDEEGNEEEEMGGDLSSKKVPLGFMKKKMAKKVKKESVEEFLSSLSNSYAPKKVEPEQDFWSSISRHYYDARQKFSDGFSEYKEDYLITPEEPKAEAEEPKAGEVGFAPQQRIDTGLVGYNLPPLDESKKPTKSWWM